jgi:predicted ATPase
MSHKAHTRMHDVVIDHPKALENCKNPIFRICLTGGPCAGKTTAIASLTQALQDRGFYVLQVPEAATMLMKGGAFIQTGQMTFSDAVKF